MDINVKNIQINEDDFNTYEKCKMMVENNAFAIIGVPECFMSKEIALIAVKQYGNTYRYLPEYLKNDEEIIETVLNNKEYPYTIKDKNRSKLHIRFPSRNKVVVVLAIIIIMLSASYFVHKQKDNVIYGDVVETTINIKLDTTNFNWSCSQNDYITKAKEALISKYSQQYGTDPALIRAMIDRESGGDANNGWGWGLSKTENKSYQK